MVQVTCLECNVDMEVPDDMRPRSHYKMLYQCPKCKKKVLLDYIDEADRSER
jgi:DNA-directed RNA polymerase subunit RPC12/RpoP